MNILRPIFFICAISLVSCGERAVVEIPKSHPAHADAPEAPIPAASQTLALPNGPTPTMSTHEPRSDATPPHLHHHTGGADHHADNGEPVSKAGQEQASPAGSGAGPATQEKPQNSHQEAMGTDHSPVEAKPVNDQAITYTCPMHPQIVSDKPGKCPICHMTLVPKKKEQQP